ncbi:MAG: preQ(1) synthase [Candidatus Omnitrophota bacterium]|nr:preQ(1) synthase [Candidatus Omnitrophota bacterium]MBU1928568.1 preQ(1) synthase [Candidatus Omnitrophota bacterium]MBU2034581.1 preQ(1) synthase [Candidatus Omnitrophota bacterium]
MRSRKYLRTQGHASSYEGLQGKVRKLKTPEIEVWKNQYPDRIYTISLDIPEFTCICPKTGLPDFANIKIEYSPDKHCVELKSLKMYTIFFRNVGIFHEHLTNLIMDDFIRACKPRWAKIITEFNPRGGIITRVLREYRKSR